jgi:hypothetical protein
VKKNRSSRAQDSNVGAESRRTAGTATAERAGPSRRIGPTPCGAGPPRRTLAHLSADLVVPSLRRANVVLDGPGRWPSTAQSASGRGTGLESSGQGQPGHSTCRRARKCPTSVAYRTCWIDPHGNEEVSAPGRPAGAGREMPVGSEMGVWPAGANRTGGRAGLPSRVVGTSLPPSTA